VQALQAQLESQGDMSRAGPDADALAELAELRATVSVLQAGCRSQGAAETERLLSELKCLRQQVQEVHTPLPPHSQQSQSHFESRPLQAHLCREQCILFSIAL
jgi:hypothetical protein